MKKILVSFLISSILAPNVWAFGVDLPSAGDVAGQVQSAATGAVTGAVDGAVGGLKGQMEGMMGGLPGMPGGLPGLGELGAIPGLEDLAGELGGIDVDLSLGELTGNLGEFDVSMAEFQEISADPNSFLGPRMATGSETLKAMKGKAEAMQKAAMANLASIQGAANNLASLPGNEATALFKDHIGQLDAAKNMGFAALATNSSNVNMDFAALKEKATAAAKGAVESAVGGALNSIPGAGAVQDAVGKVQGAIDLKNKVEGVIKDPVGAASGVVGGAVQEATNRAVEGAAGKLKGAIKKGLQGNVFLDRAELAQNLKADTVQDNASGEKVITSREIGATFGGGNSTGEIKDYCKKQYGGENEDCEKKLTAKQEAVGVAQEKAKKARGKFEKAEVKPETAERIAEAKKEELDRTRSEIEELERRDAAILNDISPEERTRLEELKNKEKVLAKEAESARASSDYFKIEAEEKRLGGEKRELVMSKSKLLEERRAIEENKNLSEEDKKKNLKEIDDKLKRKDTEISLINDSLRTQQKSKEAATEKFGKTEVGKEYLAKKEAADTATAAAEAAEQERTEATREQIQLTEKERSKVQAQCDKQHKEGTAFHRKSCGERMAKVATKVKQKEDALKEVQSDLEDARKNGKETDQYDKDMKKLEDQQAELQAKLDGERPLNPEERKAIEGQIAEIEKAKKERTEAYEVQAPEQAKKYLPMLEKEEAAKRDLMLATLAVQEAKRREELLAAMRILANNTEKFNIGTLQVGSEAGLTLIDDSKKDKNIMKRIIDLMVGVLATIGVLLLVISGIMMIVSHGDENLLQKGKTMFIYTVLGLVIGFFSYIVVQFIISFIFKVI